MERYYSSVEMQVKELQEFHQDVQIGFEKITKIQEEKNKKIKSQPVLSYIDSLQERYQSIDDMFFCQDYMIDGVLYDFKKFRDKQQKQTEILFQNYDRGGIKQEDIVQILLNLMKNAKKVEKVSLHAAAIKNQLIISMTESATLPQLENSFGNLDGKARQKEIKKSLKRYLKKYDGIFYIIANPNEQNQKIIIGLRRN